MFEERADLYWHGNVFKCQYYGIGEESGWDNFSREHLGGCGWHYTNSRMEFKELAVLQGNIEDEIAQELAGMEMEGIICALSYQHSHSL